MNKNSNVKHYFLSKHKLPVKFHSKKYVKYRAHCTEVVVSDHRTVFAPFNCSPCSTISKNELFALFIGRNVRSMWTVGTVRKFRTVRRSNCSRNMNCLHCSLFALFERFELFAVRTIWTVRTVRCLHNMNCSHRTFVRSSVVPGRGALLSISTKLP